MISVFETSAGACKMAPKTQYRLFSCRRAMCDVARAMDILVPLKTSRPTVLGAEISPSTCSNIIVRSSLLCSPSWLPIRCSSLKTRCIRRSFDTPRSSIWRTRALCGILAPVTGGGALRSGELLSDFHYPVRHVNGNVLIRLLVTGAARRAAGRRSWFAGRPAPQRGTDH